MSKKIPIGVSLALILVSVALTVVITVSVYLNMYNDLVQDLPQRSQQYSKLTGIDELVRSNYYGDINYDDLDENVAEGYINGLGDPYSKYISPEDFDVFEASLNGRMPGTGLEVEYDSENVGLYVTSVHPDSPAFENGLQVGSLIVSVDGEQVSAKNHFELKDKLENSKEKRVKFAVSGADETDITEYEIKNGFNEKSCFYSVNGNIGYVRFASIYDETVTQFREALSYFTEKAVTGFVLDLRNCASINLDAAAKITDIIVPVGNEGTGAIFTAKNSADETVKVYSSDSSSISLRIAVLVNDRTECAAELLACDLRDFGKAVIIGETTAGHGTMQQLFRLKDGGAVFLSVAEIYPYISDSFLESGIEPDAEIITNETFKNSIGTADLSSDEQYKKAYSYLSE